MEGWGWLVRKRDIYGIGDDEAVLEASPRTSLPRTSSPSPRSNVHCQCKAQPESKPPLNQYIKSKDGETSDPTSLPATTMTILLSLVQLVFAALAVVAALVIGKLGHVMYRGYVSPLNSLPGPRSTSWFWGSIKVIQQEDNSVPQERWAAEHGPVITYKGFLGVRGPSSLRDLRQLNVGRRLCSSTACGRWTRVR